MHVVSGRMARADGVYISVENVQAFLAQGDRRGAQVARCTSHLVMNVYFCDIYITARLRTS